MKRALITGGSGTIGAALCRRLAADGFHVIVHARQNADRAQALVTELRAGGASAQAICFDVTRQADAEAALTRLLADRPVQVLVHNAGVSSDAPLAGMKPEQWREVIDVSLNGFYNIANPLLLPMMRTRWGRIISLSSVAAILGNRGQANYAAAKAGLHGACKSLALEVASRGVTVNVVAPGVIESPMVQRAFTPEQIAALVPMKRAGTPEEVADLVSFLASDHAGYITGQVISINGGMA